MEANSESSLFAGGDNICEDFRSLKKFGTIYLMILTSLRWWRSWLCSACSLLDAATCPCMAVQISSSSSVSRFFQARWAWYRGFPLREHSKDCGGGERAKLLSRELCGALAGIGNWRGKVRGGGISGIRCVTYFQFIMFNSTSRAVTQSSSSILQ